MNLLRRAQGCFAGGRTHAIAALRRAEMVASDETGVRIEGSNAYHWVFRSSEAVVHQAAQTRAASVVRDMMDGRQPAVWMSDRYAAQQGHGAAHQTCLAHLARDVAYAVEASDDPVPWRLQIWLQSVFALAGRVTKPGGLDTGGQAQDPGPAPNQHPRHREFLRRDPGTPGQDRTGPRSTPDLPRPSRSSRGDQQCLRARPAPGRCPAQSDQRLSGDVGR